MTWTARYPNAKFAETLVANLITQVGANEAAALSWANDGQPMEAFKTPYRKSRWVNTLWPNLSFIIQDTAAPESDDESRLEESHSVVVVVEDVGPDADSVAASVQKRVRAVAMIIIGLTGTELLAGQTRAGSVSKEISTIDYRDFFNEQQSIYKKTAQFTLTVNFMETK